MQGRGWNSRSKSAERQKAEVNAKSNKENLLTILILITGCLLPTPLIFFPPSTLIPAVLATLAPPLSLCLPTISLPDVLVLALALLIAVAFTFAVAVATKSRSPVQRPRMEEVFEVEVEIDLIGAAAAAAEEEEDDETRLTDENKGAKEDADAEAVAEDRDPEW